MYYLQNSYLSLISCRVTLSLTPHDCFRGCVQADVELRVTQERLKLVNQHLGRLAAECTEVAPSIMLYCHQANIPPPKIAPQLTRNKAFGSRWVALLNGRAILVFTI